MKKNQKNPRSGRGSAIDNKIAQALGGVAADRSAALRRRARRRAVRWWVVEARSGLRSLYEGRRPDFGAAQHGPYQYKEARRVAGW